MTPAPAALRPGTPLAAIDPQRFAACFNRRPFLIRHHLADHPLFALPRLIDLARRLPADRVEYNAGDVPVSLDPRNTPRTGLSVEETIRRIEECRSWMVLKNVEHDTDYRALLDACLDQLRPYTEPLAPGMSGREGFVFISSPGSVTPYHIDPENNFLLQIRGTKRVSVFDPRDRHVISEHALEAFFGGADRNLVYRDAYQDRATVFELAPGDAVHVPVAAPHWVKNGPRVSLSFSITFRTADSDRREILYRMNHRLRRWRLGPVPVGQWPALDDAKYFLFRGVRRARRALRLTAPAAADRAYRAARRPAGSGSAPPP
jgi:hypothetical protein